MSTSIPATFAAKAAPQLRAAFPDSDERTRNFLKLAGEAGEAVEAFARYAGMSRRSGPLEDVAAELADVVLTAYIAAGSLGIDLDAACAAKAAVIENRPWRNARKENSPAETEDAYVRRSMAGRAMSLGADAPLLSYEEYAAIEAGFRREYQRGRELAGEEGSDG